LTIRGEVVYAIRGTNQIIIRNYTDTGQEYRIFDYVLSNIVLMKDDIHDYPDRFYVHDNQIYYADYQRVVNFNTDKVLYYNGTFNQTFLDFNPVSYKVLFNSFDDSDLYTPRLILRDLNQNSPEIAILYGWSIGFAKILNDGKTVIYNNGQAFYKISTESI
jgi:hypothetical protein